MDTVQINLTVPKFWKEELERVARVLSVEEDKTLLYSDLIRRAVQEQFQLSEVEVDGGTNEFD